MVQRHQRSLAELRAWLEAQAVLALRVTAVTPRLLAVLHLQPMVQVEALFSLAAP